MYYIFSVFGYENSGVVHKTQLSDKVSICLVIVFFETRKVSSLALATLVKTYYTFFMYMVPLGVSALGMDDF